MYVIVIYSHDCGITVKLVFQEKKKEKRRRYLVFRVSDSLNYIRQYYIR